MLPVIADQQIQRGTAATLSWQNVDGDGEPAAPAGAVTVSVERSDGTVVLSPGTATSGSGDNPRTVALTAVQNADLDLLTVTWTDTGDASSHVTVVEVVGGFYFTVAEARSSDPALENDTKYPQPALVAARRQVEEEFERICDVAFVPRYRRDVVPVGCHSLLLAPQIRVVRSVATVAGNGTETAWTDEQLDWLRFEDWGVVQLLGNPVPSAAVAIAYEHGYDRPPSEVKRAALQRLRYLLSQPLTGLPDRATSFSVAEGGTYKLDQAGATKTGIPDIDAVLHRWSMRVPGVA